MDEHGAPLAVVIAAGADTTKTACALRPGQLIHDRDRIFAWSLDESIRNLGMIVPFAWFPEIRH